MVSYFISCDWGTSRLRLRLVDLHSLDIIGEVDSEIGIASLYRSWQKQAGASERTSFYSMTLRHPLEKLEIITGKIVAGLPVICSGMASSSIGILELPYAELPFSLDGKHALMDRLTTESLPNPIFLISGLKSDTDVMRGEETELVGMHLLLQELPQEYIAIIPGTHSKHITVRDNMIVSFDTYMTGEIFNILLNSSTLRHSVAQKGLINWSGFREGVNKSAEESLLQSLFQVRVNELLHGMDKQKNYAFLSGLLIGAELTPLKKLSQMPIVLLGNTALNPLYETAIRHLGLGGALMEIPCKIRERAVIRGQLQIYSELKNTI